MFRLCLPCFLVAGVAAATLSLSRPARAQELPQPDKAKTVEMFRVPNYCEGVCFDHAGKGYISWGKTITQFTLDGKHANWAETGAPNGHKILADGTHLVCDASQHAVLHLAADGKLLEPRLEGVRRQAAARAERPDARHGQRRLLFQRSGRQSSDENPIGTVHYVDQSRQDARCSTTGWPFPTASSCTPDGKKLLLAESQKNRVLVYDVTAPGKVGEHESLRRAAREGHGRRADRQPARRHVPRRRRQPVRRPLRHEAGAGARSRRQADPPIRRRQRHHQQRRLRRPEASTSSSSPAASATKRAKAGCSASTWA